ncbi:MAG: hypothetical protein GX638_13020 [Crenarchaeota archaeon]|nr:hypothetical protein [Thermoproteota archaeon]
MNKAILISLTLLFNCFNHFKAQSPQASWTLSQPVTGNKTYIARDYISLKPGFQYTATGNQNFNAQIDQCLLFPPTTNTYALPGGLITSNPSEGGVVGSIPGEYSVSPSGAATYTIPIEVLQGINGMQPNISLVYNSQTGNGIAGWGWNIGGVSMISRVPKNLYFDNSIKGIDWTNDSPLALDGQRLIKTGSNEYKTESETYNKITAEGLRFWGPEVIKVETKDGIIMEYGSKGSDISYSPISFSNRLGWLLSKVYDKFGNYIKYNYSYGSNVTYKDLVLESITYGSSADGEKEIGRINFSYGIRSDEITGIIDGTPTRNNRILNTIETYSGGTLFRRYVLSYTTCNIQKSRLKSVDCYNSNGEKINPNNINWNSINTIIAVNSTSSSFGNSYGVQAKDKVWYSSDVDGDGISELVGMYRYHDSSGKYWTHFETFKQSNNSGTTSFQSSGFYRTSIVNFELGSFKSFVHGSSSIKFTDLENPWLVLPWLNKTDYWCNIEFYDIKSTLFTGINLKTRVNSIPVYGFNDLNNDGFDDIVVIEQAKNNDKYPLYILYGNADKKNIRENFLSLNFNGKPDKLFISDLNGDGLKDLLVVTNKGYNVIWNNGGSTVESGVVKIGLTVGLSITNGILNSSCSVIKPGDFNGDGFLDFIVNEKNNSTWYFVINQGNGYYGNFSKHSLPQITAIEESFTGKNDDKDQCIVMDFDNDGKDDIIIIESDYKKKNSNWPSTSVYGEFRSSYVAWYKSSGTGVSEIKKLLTNKEDYSYINYVTTGDFDGDGRTDLVNFSSNLYNSVEKNTGKFFLHSSRKINFSEGLVTNIKDGFNNTISFSYKPLTDNSIYSIGNVDKNNEPIFRVRGPLVVTSTISMGKSGIFPKKYEYSYKNALFHTTGKGFLGFMGTISKETVSGTELRIDNSLNTTFNTIVPYTSEQLIDGIPISKTTQNISLEPMGLKIYIPRVLSIIEENKVDGITSTKSFSDYDYSGNPRNITTDFGDGILEKQELTYMQSGSWCANKVSTVKTTFTNSSGSDVVEKHFDYFTNGRLKKETVHPGKGSFEVNTEYSYDNFGNVTNIKVSNNGQVRQTEMTYTPSGRFLKTKKNLELDEEVSFNYDETRALLVSETSQIGTTTYQYDGFGRLVKTKYPTNVETINALQWAGGNGPNGTEYYAYTETSGQSPVKVWYDSFGREMRRDFYGLNEELTSVTTEYNTKGQVYRVSEPYFTSSGPTVWAVVNTYYNDGRIKQVETLAGTTSYAYINLKTTVTTPSGVTETTLNAAGQVLSSKVDGKTVTYSYFPNGLTKSATPEGLTAVTFEYDPAGNRTKIVDPNAGTIETKYNGLGQLVERKQKIHSETEVITTYNYLPSGLIDEINLNGEITKHEYDSRNRLKKVTLGGNVHVKEYNYDDFNRPVSVTETIENSKIFNFSTEYDAFGRVIKETWPTSYFTTNQYDKYGLLKSVTDQSGEKLFEATEANAKGQLKKYKQGGREVSIDYHNQWNMPTSMVAPGVMSMHYQYDNKGNLESRYDYLTHQEERFLYDGANRLSSYEILNDVSAQTYNISYDPATGGITTKPYVGFDMAYQGDGKPLHALSRVSGIPAFIGETPQDIEYTDFSKVKRITQGNKTHQITYGVDRQRIKGTFATSGNTTLTKYYLGSYEEEHKPDGSIRKLHYIYTGNGLTAIMVKNGSTDSLYYTYCDYQGNLLAVTDALGNVKEKLAYGPWGLRRSPSNWTQTDIRTSFLFSRGYTMHEHLDGFGLINMNGRVYDPIMAQFLSPDPFIQAPGNWYNYNRYGYCLNNPLIYTDPSGEFFWMPVIIGAIIGAASGATQAEMNDRPWYQGMIWGAVIGGATGYLSGFAPTQWIGSTLYGAGLGAASGGAMAYATGGDVNRSMITGAIVGGAIGFASSEQFGNMVNGQGFRSNDNVLKSFVSKGKYQEALDYFGIQGKYDPSNQIFNNEVGGGAAAVDPETGEIFWGDGAFNYGYDRLAFAADHELIHSQNVLSGKYKDVKIDFEVAGREEWSTYMKNYQRQGLYHNHGVNIISRINQYGSQAGIYGTYVTPTGSYSSNFNVQWWHFIYKIPRRW